MCAPATDQCGRIESLCAQKDLGAAGLTLWSNLSWALTVHSHPGQLAALFGNQCGWDTCTPVIGITFEIPITASRPNRWYEPYPKPADHAIAACADTIARFESERQIDSYNREAPISRVFGPGHSVACHTV